MSTAGDEWIKTLDSFLKSKLRATPANTMRHLNTAFHIDGVIMSIIDHPSLWNESLKALTNHLKDTKGHPTDHYTAWCLLDAAMKSQEVPRDLRMRLFKQLPQLLSSYMLPFVIKPAPTVEEEELRQLYLNILRALPSTPGMPGDVLRNCELHLKELLRRTQGADAASGSGARAAEIVKMLRKMGSPNELGKKRKNDSEKVPEAELGPRGVAKFVAGLYDADRTRYTCLKCGGFFTSEAAEALHRQVHSYHNVTQGENLIRLRGPTATEFVQHSVVNTDGQPLPTTGEYVKAFMPLSAAQKCNGKVNSLRLLSADQKAKRHRADKVVVVSDPEEHYECHVCKQQLKPQLSRGEWVLTEVEEEFIMKDGQKTRVFVHSGCR